ncbi:MAG: DNA phosphorothioation-dependent restriction protein DptG [Candidatus Scalindua sp.]|jgi:DNA phosphorothioation-dependent restriction protein DptG|nr:DNA phosphorothioation-dependent restriction protein DptG [Candidatus Scalindua sp.]
MSKSIQQLYKAEIQARNFVQSYLPIRNKGHEFDFSAIAGAVGATLIRKKLPKSYSIEDFENQCLTRFKWKITDQAFLGILKQMYFTGDGLLQVSPLFYIFDSINSKQSGDKHMSALFQNMIIAENNNGIKISSSENFLEKEILNEFKSNLITHDYKLEEQPYLPFLSDYFVKDIKFLASSSKYYLVSVEKFLKLYGFLYTSQLALNLNGWTEIPKTKPLHFILDTEKASSERLDVKRAYNTLKKTVADLFPVLSILEYFNQDLSIKRGLWSHYDDYITAPEYDSAQLTESIISFLKNYRDVRGLGYENLDDLDGRELFVKITKAAKDVFNDQKRRPGPFDVNKKYIKAIMNDIASHFVQQRGRSGYVLVVNQDNLLLLTNIVIGYNDRLPFRELLDGFKERGMWFDSQSEVALINFYERVGNVERMSDSGDAVYVRKTI